MLIYTTLYIKQRLWTLPLSIFFMQIVFQGTSRAETFQPCGELRSQTIPFVHGTCEILVPLPIRPSSASLFPLLPHCVVAAAKPWAALLIYFLVE
ncbi:hypothetical protein LQ764DRAFT_233697 [Zygosaccharomyces rouxii]|nr:hypothetical protein LQ764DRAFT_233697 [Zygosaccharomyces rouxii]